jgi:hypothetical protein
MRRQVCGESFHTDVSISDNGLLRTPPRVPAKKFVPETAKDQTSIFVKLVLTAVQLVPLLMERKTPPFLLPCNDKFFYGKNCKTTSIILIKKWSVVVCRDMCSATLPRQLQVDEYSDNDDDNVKSD